MGTAPSTSTDDRDYMRAKGVPRLCRTFASGVAWFTVLWAHVYPSPSFGTTIGLFPNFWHGHVRHLLWRWSKPHNSCCISLPYLLCHMRHVAELACIATNAEKGIPETLAVSHLPGALPVLLAPLRPLQPSGQHGASGDDFLAPEGPSIKKMSAYPKPKKTCLK